MTTETRYYRSDTITVNTRTNLWLGTSKSGTASNKEVSWQSATQADAYVRILIYKVEEDGTLVEITSGAVVTISPNTTQVLSATVDVPETALAETDAVLVTVQYSTDGSTWASIDSWITEQLGATVLNSATWTAVYDLDYESTYSPFTRRYNNYLRFRFDGDYESRIENFTYGVVAVKKPFKVFTCFSRGADFRRRAGLVSLNL